MRRSPMSSLALIALCSVALGANDADSYVTRAIKRPWKLESQWS